ncbi:BCCT family transporter [Shewanella sp. WXL01]|uniref:BCCT family transporter n=1 Tax=Shewanella sp. WXL01 TaxID=2709721 RepID=UPI0014384EEB|nr:BCCT family transporter [Shewanella sp. WXL01]NKF49116.1 BCCT family transporter [Shewanella sp. WXL01]
MELVRNNNAASHSTNKCGLLSNIDKFKFFTTFFLVMSCTVPLFVYPETSKTVVSAIFHYITHELGWVYMITGIIAFTWSLWLAFGRFGDKKLGEEKQYSDYGWIVMLLCAGVGSGIMYGSMLDWARLASLDIHGVEAGSVQSLEVASTYAMFHWGPVAWSIYAALAIPIAYQFHVRNVPVLNISQSCHFLLGKQVDKLPGKLIDIAFMVGIIGGAATSLGLAAPIVSAGICSVTGIENGTHIDLMVLMLVTAIFTISSYKGLKSGLQILSDLNVWLSVGLLAFVLFVSNTQFLVQMGLGTFGSMLSNALEMATYMDPIAKTGLSSGETVFYWAWWASFAPFMSLFIAKISRGRTVRATVLATLVAASCGCSVFYMIFGNFSLNLHLTGAMDIVSLVKTMDNGELIMAMAQHLPMADVFIVVFSVVCIIFLATSYDAVSYSLSATTTAHITPKDEPARWNRIFWALMLSVLPMGILALDGPRSVLQTAAVVAGLPTLIVLFTGISSFLAEIRMTGWKPKAQ